MDGQIRAIEKDRVDAYAGLRQQVGQPDPEPGTSCAARPAGLVRALRNPSARGRWGEIQLKRVVEMAGMPRPLRLSSSSVRRTGRTAAGCGPTLSSGCPAARPSWSTRRHRSTPISPAVDAADDDAERARQLARHARQVREHLRQLGSKAYWNGFDPHAGIRGAVPARRGLLLRRAGAGPGADRGGHRAERHPGHADHADRAAARGRLWLAPGAAGRECPPYRRGRPRPLRTDRQGRRAHDPTRAGSWAARSTATTRRSGRWRAGCWSPPAACATWMPRPTTAATDRP